MQTFAGIFVAFMLATAGAISPVRIAQAYNEDLAHRAMFFSSVANCSPATI
jgi:hypothetical protein